MSCTVTAHIYIVSFVWRIHSWLCIYYVWVLYLNEAHSRRCRLIHSLTQTFLSTIVRTLARTQTLNVTYVCMRAYTLYMFYIAVVDILYFHFIAHRPLMSKKKTIISSNTQLSSSNCTRTNGNVVPFNSIANIVFH